MSNRTGICPLCRLVKPVSGTIEHLLLSGGCPCLKQGCQWYPLLQQTWSPSNYYWRTMNPTTMQFLLDCSVLEPALKLSQESESDQIKVFVTQRWLLFLARATSLYESLCHGVCLYVCVYVCMYVTNSRRHCMTSYIVVRCSQTGSESTIELLAKFNPILM